LKVLIIGSSGQIGSALLEMQTSLGDVVPLDRSALDLANVDSIHTALLRVRPGVIINAAACTAVDQAERDEALAFRVNAAGPETLAKEAAKLGALLVHFSTDYVYDGEKPAPYVESDAPNPLNAYGRSKLAGDQAIQASGCRHLIFRTSWVYAATGRNFLTTMLRLAREGKPLRVVDDQYGAPTSNLMIARAVVSAVRTALDDPSVQGLYHMTAAGRTSWHDFAHAIFQAANLSPELRRIPTGEFPAPARRPRNSVLDNRKLTAVLGIRMPPWQEGLREVIQATTP
jgi:dTDP-4-dehydrorhamnose reductase